MFALLEIIPVTFVSYFFHILVDFCGGGRTDGYNAVSGNVSPETCAYFDDAYRWPCIICVHFTCPDKKKPVVYMPQVELCP
jgi:hypothetical protein